MIRSRRVWAVLVALFALLVGALAIGWTGGGHRVSAGQAKQPDQGARSTVTVSRQDVSEIVTLSATLKASPTCTVAAARGGRVERRGGIAPGTALPAGRVLFRAGTGVVRTPVAGTFERWLVPNRVTVAAGLPVAQVAYAGFGEVASLPPEAAYRILRGRLTARANITNGPGPFDCPILQSPSVGQAGPGADSSSGGGPTIVCAVPASVRAFNGLSGLVAVRSREAHGVLVLPTSAVAGTVQTGEVSVVRKDGSVSVQPVGLGLTDGAVVQITSGLREGARVLATAPPLTGSLP